MRSGQCLGARSTSVGRTDPRGQSLPNARGWTVALAHSSLQTNHLKFALAAAGNATKVFHPYILRKIQH